jgi:tryptophanyl-tRNA synthetase
MARLRIFSGIQPSGELHLGNYFGAIENWVRLQDDYDCVYCVVDYHALTQEIEPAELPGRTLRVAADLLACGIDPERSILFVQSHVPEHTELAWVFNCVASYGDLARMTQFKDKSEQAAFVSAGLLVYPALQAADILLYRAPRVPVGEDQVQHLELTRRIGRRFNGLVGEEFFPEVEPLLTAGRRIMSLADPGRKMSKSLGPGHYIGIMEDAASAWKKVRSAVTDTGGTPSGEMSPGVENLFGLLRLTAPEEAVESLLALQRQGKLMYKDLKEQLRDHLEATFAPIRRRRAELSDEEVRDVLADGRRRAAAIAGETMARVRELLGVGPGALAGGGTR